jgi:hypothetical protein
MRTARAGSIVGLLRSGEVSVLGAAVIYGLSTTLSVIALHHVRPVELAAVQLGGAAIVPHQAAAPSPPELPDAAH